jgi:hypothetical protein
MNDKQKINLESDPLRRFIVSLLTVNIVLVLPAYSVGLTVGNA